MPNIHDVAKLAGVAPITVSRVINNNGYVSAKTRQRVENAIDELGYVPNALGPSLRSKRTMTLALVLSDITNPFWTTVTRGVEDTANENGYHIIIGNTDESPEKQSDYLTFMLQKQVDGFLLVPASSNVTSSDIFQRQRVPFVVLDRQILGNDYDSVRSDSRDGACKLTKYLLELGHKRIAVITIFATNNFIAIGVMRALRDQELHVPEDMSVVAFDDLPAAITIDPFFTVASQQAYEMGKKATELLIARLVNEAPKDPQEIILPVDIIVRQSSSTPLDAP